MSSKLVEEFAKSSSTRRRLFLAEMAINHTDPDSRELHRVLSELHEKLNEIHGDPDES